jgi:hypothetical protein
MSWDFEGNFAVSIRIKCWLLANPHQGAKALKNKDFLTQGSAQASPAPLASRLEMYLLIQLNTPRLDGIFLLEEFGYPYTASLWVRDVLQYVGLN